MLAVLLSLVLVALAILVVRKARAHFSALAPLPGPQSPSLILGSLMDLEKSRIGTRFNLWMKQYGHTYKMMGPFMEPLLILSDPKGVSYVLSDNNYVRPHSDRVILELFFGKSMFCAEGEEHRQGRKMHNGTFTPRSIQEISHVFFELAYQLKNQWDEKLDDQNGVIFDVAPGLHALSLDAISMTMFMYNLSKSEGNIPSLLHKMTGSPRGGYFALLMEVFISSFPNLLKLPSPMKTWADNLRMELTVIAEEVWAGKDSVGMHAKVLESLKGDTASGEPVSKGEAIAQITGMLFAGSETSANVIAECFYELSHNPDIQKKLREELVAFEAAHGLGPASYDALTNATSMPYLDAVMREILRTKAVLREISRAAAADDIIPLHFPVVGSGAREVKVTAGQQIRIPVRDGANISEDIWGPDATTFRPERWLEEDGLPESAKLMRGQGNILTFGDGLKVCLGRSFALAEFKIIVAVMVRHFTFEPDGSTIDFYHWGSNTVKPVVRTREAEGVQMPLRVWHA